MAEDPDPPAHESRVVALMDELDRSVLAAKAAAAKKERDELRAERDRLAAQVERQDAALVVAKEAIRQINRRAIPGGWVWARSDAALVRIDAALASLAPRPSGLSEALDQPDRRLLDAIRHEVEECGDQPGAFGVLMGHHLRFLLRLIDRLTAPPETPPARHTGDET